MHNTVYDQFQKKLLWVANNRIEFDGIRVNAEDIALTFHWYEQISGIYGSDIVYIFYCYDPPQVQSHTQIVHGKISVTRIYGTAERHTSERYKSPSPSESLHGNDLYCK